MTITKKASLITKLVVLALLIYLATTLLNLRGQINAARADQSGLSQQVAEQSEKNAELSDAIENSDDPDRIAAVARDKLGLVKPGEKVFIYTK
ncbi:Cell division protein FtsL [bioreactor metagenome]|uniref:Cell division protein FtsL n=1 Tax=bioreactor metagenome TaxID=1076179 RepID=A0A644WGQ5_9ZZZZ